MKENKRDHAATVAAFISNLPPLVDTPTAPPTLLDAAKGTLREFDSDGIAIHNPACEVFHALRAAIAAEEARILAVANVMTRLGGSPQRMENTLDMIIRLEAENADLRAALEMVNDFEPYVRDEEDEEIRERNEAWIAQARAILAKKESV